MMKISGRGKALNLALSLLISLSVTGTALADDLEDQLADLQRQAEEQQAKTNEASAKVESVSERLRQIQEKLRRKNSLRSSFCPWCILIIQSCYRKPKLI